MLSTGQRLALYLTAGLVLFRMARGRVLDWCFQKLVRRIGAKTARLAQNEKMKKQILLNRRARAIAWRLILGVSSVVMAACATPEKTPEPAAPPPPATAEATGNVDLDKLQQALGLDGERDAVGYNEKSFGTCDMGYGFSRNRDCRTQYLVVLRFRLQCRESEGTSADVVDQQTIHAITNDKVRWNVGVNQGFTNTDGEGFGVVRFIAPRSQKRERAKLTIDGRYLVMRAEDMSRMVTPADWCAK